jgi:hypothetical protein
MTDGTSSSLRLWPDNPTAVDLLGFADIAAPVIEAIRRERLDPVAVGVFGDWGSGKTTILEILNQHLEGEKKTIVVYTRPWEYDPTLDARATLITEVLDKLREKAEADSSFWAKTKDKFIGLAGRIRWSKAITLAGRSAVTFSLPDVGSLVEIFGDEEKVSDPTLQGFRAEFAELMAEFKDVERLIVLVDDLDRCLPETVVMTLEAIKLFLSVEKMAFVVAADEALVKLAIARHFDRDQQGDRMAGDYLEKIVQIPVAVPALGRGDTQAYLAMMMLDQHLGGDAAALVKIAEHCSARRRDGNHLVFEDFPDGMLPESAGEDLALAGELAPVLYERLDGNPRRLKRFLNALWVRADIAARRGIKLSPRTLAKLMVLERIEPDAFGQLLDWMAEGVLAERLTKLESGEDLDESFHSAFGWWAELPPKLGDTNLAPYLRLAAALRRRSGPSSELTVEQAELLEELRDESTATREKALKRLAELPESERRVMAREIVNTVRFDPSAQQTLAEALGALIEEEVFNAEIGDGLERIDASRVEAALVLAIAGEGEPAEPIRSVIRTWSESGKLKSIAKNAADEVLGGGS